MFTALLLLSIAAADSRQECSLPPAPLAELGELYQGSRAFVGCRPSAGECANSCPERDGQAELDPGTCDGSEGDFACYCPTGEPEPVDPFPEASGTLIGCRPSAGECVNSCPTRKARWASDPAVCGPGEPEGSVACYCL